MNPYCVLGNPSCLLRSIGAILSDYECSYGKSHLKQMHYEHKCLVVLFSIVFFVIVMVAQPIEAGVVVGNRKQLFVDDWIVAEKINVGYCLFHLYNSQVVT